MSFTRGFPSRPLTAQKQRKSLPPSSINDMLLKRSIATTSETDTTRFFRVESKGSEAQNAEKGPLIFLDDYEHIPQNPHKDVYYHSKRLFDKQKRYTLTMPTHLTTQQSSAGGNMRTQPVSLKNHKAKSQISLKSEVNFHSQPIQSIQPQAIAHIFRQSSQTRSPTIRSPTLVKVNEYTLAPPTVPILEREPQVIQVGLEEKRKPLIEPVDLKALYDELGRVDNKLERMAQDSENFAKNLYSDREKFLKVRDNVLTEYELLFLIEQLKLKQELIAKQQSFESLNFDEIDAIIRKLSFFERFTKSTRINLLKLGVYMEVPPGEYVFHQGDFGDNLFVILSGSVVVKVEKHFKADNQTVEQVVSSLYDGQHFGELAMMETQQKGEEVVLEEKLENINIKSFDEVRRELFRQDMEILEKQSRILKNMRLQELQRKNSNVLNWMQDEPKERHFVMKLVNDEEDIGTQQASTVRASNIQYQKVDKRMLRKASIQASETCHMLGISRENFKNILMVLMQDELEQKIKMLKSLRMFNHIQPFVLIPLANQLIAHRFRLDEVIVREGEQLEYMYIVHKGSCNVIRKITTKRIVIQEEYRKKDSRKSSKYLLSHPPRPIVEMENDYLEAMPVDGDETYKMREFGLQKTTNDHIEYEKSYIYKRLYTGDIVFGRVLTGLTLEGNSGVDKARMSVVSSSSQTIMYKISQKLLQFCPEFLIQHLINQLIVMKEVDEIPKSQLNQEIKAVWKARRKPTLDEKLLEQEQQRKKKMLQEYLLRNRLRKPQDEYKQDIRNQEWEDFKQMTCIEQFKYNNVG